MPRPSLRGLAVAIALLACPCPSHASDMSASASHTSGQPTASSPSYGSSTGGVTGSYDIVEDVSIDAAVSITRPTPAPPTTNPLDKTNGGTVAALTLGGSWSPGDHWLVFGTGTWSPKSTELSTTTVQLTGPKGGTTDADALIRAVSSSGGGLLVASYDTAGEGDYETSVTLSGAVTHYATTQRVQEIQTADGIKTEQELVDACAGTAKGSKMCKRLKPLLAKQDGAVTQMAVALSVVETFFEDTDVALGATYYLYDKNPNDVGFFTVAAAGRSTSLSRGGTGGAMASFGTGVALAPMQWNGTLGVVERLGDWKLSLIGGYGRYVDDAGSSGTVTIKTQYKFNEHWKALVVASGQVDRDQSDSVTKSGSLGATVRYTF